jgi:hypothetical protein
VSPNLYLDVLPPLRSLVERRDGIAVLPHYHPAERQMRHVDRRFSLMRLLRFFDPALRHLRISEGIDQLVRAGYETRNPANGGFKTRSRNLSRSLKAKTLLFSQPVSEAAPALTAALIGAPGLGKTRTVERTLAAYAQVVRHSDIPTQITWLKLEYPKRGSLRSLCLQFLTKMSGLVGSTDYTDLYVPGGATEADLQNMMALVANFHGLGLLVIDEIQHVGRSLDGEHDLMTFLTGLSNQLGIPLLIIGTLSVLPRLESTGRMARRAVGPASAVWHPLPFQDEWRDLFDRLWQYQWTCEFTEPSEALRQAFFECSGGILDLLVKLFLSVQLRLLYRSELRGGGDERITPEFVRSVADVDFRPVRHIVKALLGGDEKQIMRFDDLHSFDSGFRSALAQLVDPLIGQRLAVSENTSASGPKIEMPQGDQYEAIWSKLRAMGLGEDLILRLIDGAKADGLDAQQDPFGFYEHVLKGMRQAKRQQKAIRHEKLASLEAHDLRRLVVTAVEQGLTALEILRAAGLVGILPEKRAA